MPTSARVCRLVSCFTLQFRLHELTAQKRVIVGIDRGGYDVFLRRWWLSIPERGEGGSTNAWGGWCFRYRPEDFHLESNAGEGIDWAFD